MKQILIKKYRLDIQGLRALAVILVFFSHASQYIFTGGFVGVDVFFVISGYVITQLILVEKSTTQNFNFLRFYTNRLKRLLPALMLMVIVVLLVLFWLLPKSILDAQIESAISATAWVSNIYFIFQNQDYFSNWGDSNNFFLHTWSLGIEEQFYLVWPFVLVYLANQKLVKSNLLIGLIILTVASLLFHFLISLNVDLYSFYLMPARFWQFALGGLAAFIQIHNSHAINRSGSVSMFYKTGYLMGLVMILFAAAYLNSSFRYPYIYVLIPTIGTFLVLVCFTEKGSWYQKILSSQPMVFIGNISYSFYLWHWPIILLIEQSYISSSVVRIVVSFIVTLLISMLSYYFFENPIRKFKSKHRYTEQIAFFLSVVVVSCSLMYGLKNIVNVTSQSDADKISKSASDVPPIYQYGCDTWYESSEVKACQFGDVNSPNVAVMFGDSVLAQWYSLVAKKYTQNEWKLIVLTKSACPMVDEPFYYERIKRNYQVCEIWRNDAIKFIEQIKPKVLILGSSTIYPYSEQQWKSGTQRILDSFTEKNINIKLVAGSPELGFHGPQCLMQSSELTKECTADLTYHDSWNWLESVAGLYSDVSFLEFSDFICPNQICQAEFNNQIIFRDDKHLTNTFVLSLYDELESKF